MRGEEGGIVDHSSVSEESVVTKNYSTALNRTKQELEYTKTLIRGAHTARQGNAAGQVMPSPGNNGLMCEAWHWSGSRVMSCLFSGFSNSLFKN